MQNNPQLVFYSLILQKHIFFKDRTENIFYILTSLTTCVPQSQKWGHGVNGQCLADTVSGTNMFLYSSGSKFGLPIVCSSQHFLCEICVVCSFFFCFFARKTFLVSLDHLHHKGFSFSPSFFWSWCVLLGYPAGIPELSLILQYLNTSW